MERGQGSLWSAFARTLRQELLQSHSVKYELISPIRWKLILAGKSRALLLHASVLPLSHQMHMAQITLVRKREANIVKYSSLCFLNWCNLFLTGLSHTLYYSIKKIVNT